MGVGVSSNRLSQIKSRIFALVFAGVFIVSAVVVGVVVGTQNRDDGHATGGELWGSVTVSVPQTLHTSMTRNFTVFSTVGSDPLPTPRPAIPQSNSPSDNLDCGGTNFFVGTTIVAHVYRWMVFTSGQWLCAGISGVWRLDAGSTIQVQFTAPTRTITINTTTGGTVTPSGAQNMREGVATTITATVTNSDFRFVNWTRTAGTTGTFANANNTQTTFTPGTTNATIQANFERIPRTITIQAAEGGSVTPASGNQPQGLPFTITAIPDPNWAFSHWERTAGTHGTFGDPYQPSTTFTPGASNATIKAFFTPLGGGLIRFHFTSGQETLEPRWFMGGDLTSRTLPWLDDCEALGQFQGWYTTRNFTVGTEIEVVDANVRGTVNVFARWI